MNDDVGFNAGWLYLGGVGGDPPMPGVEGVSSSFSIGGDDTVELVGRAIELAKDMKRRLEVERRRTEDIAARSRIRYSGADLPPF